MTTTKFTKKQLYFLKDICDEPEAEFIQKFREEWPTSSMTDRQITGQTDTMINWPFEFEKYVEQHTKSIKKWVKWTEEEETYLKENYVHTNTQTGRKKSTLYKDIIIALEKISGNQRTPASVRRKLTRLRARAGAHIKPHLIISVSLDAYPLHPDLKLKEGETLDKGADYPYSVVCNKGHETKKEPIVFHKGCLICAQSKPLFKHHNPLEAGIFYWGDLIDSNLNDFKLGKTLERRGVDKRAENYGTFEYEEVHKPIGEVEEFEQYMKLRYEEYATHNPMLKENGSTECFDKIVLPDLKWFINIWTTQGLPEVKTRLDMALKI